MAHKQNGVDVKVGERVVVLLSVDDVGKKAYTFGEGTYVGSEVPYDAVGAIATFHVQHGLPNPKINLDSGESVYGCECWWGAASQIYFKFAGYTFIPVSLEEHRKKVGGPCADC